MKLRYSLVACAALALSPIACMMQGQSRVAMGQLYTPGNPTYDAYFRDVHNAQVEAAAWGDGKKTSHKALVDALDLTPDAPDVTLVEATHEAASKFAKAPGSLHLDVNGSDVRVVGGDAPLFRAIESAARAELDHAKKMHGQEPRLDALAKQGKELEEHARTDFEKRGEQKLREVENELAASLDAVAKLQSRAKYQARESEDFVSDLERALEVASEERGQKKAAARAAKTPKSDSSSSTTTASSKPSKPKPSADSSEPSTPKPKPETPPPAQKPADTGEVFTP